MDCTRPPGPTLAVVPLEKVRVVVLVRGDIPVERLFALAAGLACPAV
jgi:hypothetical protein